MSFNALLDKVKQAETALEAKERAASADWGQLKATWRAAWTPGRIVIAGLVSGFVVGRAEPMRRVARGGGLLQMVTALSGLMASGSAQAAAGEAAHAADSAQQQASAVSPVDALRTAAQLEPAAEPVTPETLRRAGVI